MKEIQEQIGAERKKLDRLVEASAKANQDLGENELILRQNRKLAQLLQADGCRPAAGDATDPEPDG